WSGRLNRSAILAGYVFSLKTKDAERSPPQRPICGRRGDETRRLYAVLRTMIAGCSCPLLLIVTSSSPPSHPQGVWLDVIRTPKDGRGARPSQAGDSEPLSKLGFSKSRWGIQWGPPPGSVN